MNLPAVVIGTGPVGLAAAAHLVKKGKNIIILEAGSSIASNLESYRHVRLFSRWQHNIDPVSAELLKETGWVNPEPEAFPTAAEIIDDYLIYIARLAKIAPTIKFNHRVTDIARQKCNKVNSSGRKNQPFLIRAHTPEGAVEYFACAVFDATGTWSQPNPLAGNGLSAIGEENVSAFVAYGMPDILGTKRKQYANQRTLVVGSGHSAIGNLLALSELARDFSETRIEWAIRQADANKIFGNPPMCGEPSERQKLGLRLKALYHAETISLHTNFNVSSVTSVDGKLHIFSQPFDDGAVHSIEVDSIICATGARPDWNTTRELRLLHNEVLECTNALGLLIDPNIHSCGLPRALTIGDITHPEENYFCIGAKSYGRAPNFLMITGYEQARLAVDAFCQKQSLAELP